MERTSWQPVSCWEFGKLKPEWVGTGAGERLAAKPGLWSKTVSGQTGQTPDTGQHRRKRPMWEKMSPITKPEGNLESNVSLVLAWIRGLGSRLASHWTAFGNRGVLKAQTKKMMALLLTSNTLFPKAQIAKWQLTDLIWTAARFISPTEIS